jgi:hypothetical protein
MHNATTNEERVIAAMRHWLEAAVIGLNLCPFAKAVHVRQQVRYVVSSATDTQSLRCDLTDELLALAAADPLVTDTTLLIHPYVLNDFLAYNDFLQEADEIAATLRLDGELQIASFHPDYQFADSAAGDIENYTNRAPFPTLHLLRESSVDRAVAAYPDASKIFRRNMATLQRLGTDGWAALHIEPLRASDDAANSAPESK